MRMPQKPFFVVSSVLGDAYGFEVEILFWKRRLMKKEAVFLARTISAFVIHILTNKGNLFN